MKKIALFVLFFMCISTIFFACGSKDPKNIDDENIDTPEDNSLLDFLEGYECIILQHTASDDVGTLINEANPFGYLDTTVLADEVFKRIADIEAKTKSKIDLQITNQDAQFIATSVATNIYLGDLFYSASVSVNNTSAGGGAFLPLQEIEGIDLTNTAKWGDFNVLEVNALKGNVYGVTPMLWPYKQPRVVSAFVVNTEITTSYNLGNPREYLEKKSWNWDALEQVIKDYYIIDGEVVYKAISTRFYDFLKLAVFGNGVNVLYTNDEGIPISDIGSAKAYEAIHWAQNIGREYEDNFTFGVQRPDWIQIEEAFIERQSVAALIPTSMIYSSIIYNIDQFAVLPFPSGPSGTYGQWESIIEAAESFSIFSNATDIDSASYILEMLGEPFEAFPTEEAVKEFMTRNVLFDDNDSDILFNLHKNARFSYWPQHGTTVWSGLAANIKRITASTFVEANIEKEWVFMNEYMVPNLAIYDYISK